jgi:photosystem II stability/assembly factor-like uncharacterized protein
MDHAKRGHDEQFAQRGLDGMQFVAVGDSGAVVASPDADAWTNRSIASGPTFNAVAFVDNQLIAVGNVGRIFASAMA